MKKRLFCVLIMTMLLCGCGQEETHQKQKHSSTAATTAAASDEVTTAASQEGAAEAATTSTAADTAAETTTTAADAVSGDTSAAEAASEANAAGSHSSLSASDPFAGLYGDENDGSFYMSIDNLGDSEYKVTISHKTSPGETTQWYLTGMFDGRAVLHYENCSKSIMKTSDDGSVSTETVYTNGSGYITVSERGADDTGMSWVDDVDNAGSGAFFKK